MYSSFNTLEHEKKRIQNDAQNDMRGILINQHSNHLDQRANIQSSLMQQRMSYFEPSRIDPPLGQRPILPRREEPRDQMKHASHMEQERTLHMNHFLEKQRVERDAQRINDQVDAIKKIYSKYNPHEYDPTPREHYREQDLGPAVNQLIDLLNSFKLSSTVLSSVVNITSANDLSLYAPLASPTFTGTPITSTPNYTENSTRIPTTQWVNYVVTDKLGNYVTSSALAAYNYVTNSALTAADYVTNSALQTNYVSKSLLSSYDYLTTYSAQTNYVSKSLLSSYDYVSNGTVQSYIETNYVSKSLLSSYDYLTNYSAQTNYVSKSLLSSYDYLTNSSAQTNYVSKSLLSSYDYVTNGTAQSTYAPIANATFTGTVSGITKTMVGLANVDNTSDANKPVSSATQSALNLKANIASPAFTGTVTGITSTMVGLGNVDNTSDASKPVSSATQTALNLKSNLANPTFTGTVTLPAVAFTATPASGTASFTLGIDANNTIIRTTGGSGGSVSQSTSLTNLNYSVPFSSSSASGTFTPLIDANNLLTYNPSTGIFKTPICSIPKSTSTHPNLDQYELTVGDNEATTNKSAKIIIRGQTVTDSYGPSLDFTAWNSHATPQARIEVIDDGNWGGVMSFFTKANAGGSSASLTKNMYLNTTNSGVSQMVFPSTPNIATSGGGYNWYIGGTQVGYFDYPSSNWRISTNSTQKLILGSNNQNTLQIGNSASGHYPVEIYNYKTAYGSYWQYSGGSSWGVQTTNFNIGLYVQYAVSADGGYLLASDERIKKNIKDASKGALDVIKTIPIKSHEYIDSFVNGCPTAFNVIAQDIQRTYPEAITVTDGYIPDMYVKCNWISVTGTEIRINIPKPHTVIVGDKVRYILENSSHKDTTVVQVINTTTFVVEKWDDFNLEKSDEMFLYGKLVHDFLRVDKIKLGVLGLAGTKEL